MKWNQKTLANPNGGPKKFQKGSPGGPGRPKDPPELSLIKKLTKGEFDLLMHKMLQMDLIEIGQIANDPSSKALEAIVASIAAQAIKQGDQNRLGFFSDKLFGKDLEKVKITHDFSGLSDEELAAEAEKAIKEFKSNIKER